MDGWNAWENWGGTSRSTPVATGNLALAMQAFKAEERPLADQRRGALYPDGRRGHGVATTASSRARAWSTRCARVKIAAGLGGVSVLPDSVTFGDYRGTKYDAFTSIIVPRQAVRSETFTVTNAGAAPVNLTISDDQLVRFAEKTIDVTTVDQKLETANFRMPDYLVDVEPYHSGRHRS